MKKGWEYKKLGEVISHLRTGLNPRTHFKLNTPDAESYYITVRELKGFTIEPDEKTDKVNSAAIKRINERSNLIIGDVLFSGTGTIGKTALVCELPENWNIKEGVYAMTPKHSELDSKYFIYYISSEYFLRLVNDKAAGTGVRSIPMKELVKLPILIPPLSEQQSIVDYLDSAFAKIDAMKANAEKALNEAKALFQASLKEMLEPKEGWEEKKLIQEFSLKSGENLSAKNQVIGPYPVYGGNGITGYHNQYNLSGDQILIGRVGALCGNIHYIKERIWVTDNAFVVNNISSSWNMLFLSYELEYINLNQYASQTAQPVISNKSMKDVSIFQPSLSEQQSIVTTLDSLKSKVDRLQANYEKISQECDALKQAILRQVFE